MATHSFRLPFPPSINSYWRERVVKNGKKQFVSRYITSQGKEFHRDVTAATRALWLTGRLAVSVSLVMPDRRKRDIDNSVKIILDAMGGAGVFNDDAQVDKLFVERLHVEPPGCADVTITEL